MDEHDGAVEVGELYVSDTRFRQLRDGKIQPNNLATKIKISPRRHEDTKKSEAGKVQKFAML
jgi:hypothetical protein